MSTKNDILADLVSGLPGISINALSGTNSVLDVVRRELEDDILIAELNKIMAPAANLLHNPFGFEFILSDATVLMQRCLDIRTELKNLEVTLLNDIVQKILAEKQRTYEDELSRANESYPDSVNILSKQTKLKHTVDGVEADSDSVKKTGDYEEAVKELKDTFTAESRKLEETVLEFANDRNSGLNYLARYVELKEIYWSDIRELFGKLKALSVGFSEFYWTNSRLPAINNNTNILNDYYLWLKKNMLELDKLLEKEQDFTLVISLRRGTIIGEADLADSVSLALHEGHQQKLPRDCNWVNFINNRSFLFYFTQNHQRVRVKNIGAKIVFSTRYRKELEINPCPYDYWHLTITPPQDMVYDSGRETIYKQNPISLICSPNDEFSFDNSSNKVSYGIRSQSAFKVDISQNGTLGYYLHHFGDGTCIIEDIIISINSTYIDAEPE